MLHDGDRGRGIAGGSTIAATNLRPELCNVVLMVLDHVTAYLAVETATPELLQHPLFAPGLRSERRGNPKMYPLCDRLRLRESLAVVAHQHPPEASYLLRGTLVLDHPSQRDF